MSNRKKADHPEFNPRLIDEGWGDEPHSFAFIPQQIEADWHEKWGPLLEGFPLNVLFAGIRNDAQTGQQSVAEACYWPDLATFREDSERKEICYFTKPMNAYFVRVIFEKKTGHWQTQFKGETVIRSAFGSTFDRAMLHTTIDGPEAMSAESDQTTCRFASLIARFRGGPRCSFGRRGHGGPALRDFVTFEAP